MTGEWLNSTKISENWRKVTEMSAATTQMRTSVDPHSKYRPYIYMYITHHMSTLCCRLCLSAAAVSALLCAELYRCDRIYGVLKTTAIIYSIVYIHIYVQYIILYSVYRRRLVNRVQDIIIARMVEPVEKLRLILASFSIDAFIIGSGDAHQSEYVSGSEARREFITGFTGSAGTALVLQDKALLWTDGRYFLQASKELSPQWTLMRQGEPGVLELNDWILTNMGAGQSVGVDGSLISAVSAKTLKALLDSRSIRLVPVEMNAVDIVWGEARPKMPSSPIVVHDIAYAGISHMEKIENIKQYLRANDAAGIMLSMLDEVMWLYNIRGADVDYNPVAYCYAFVSATGDSFLFIEQSKVSSHVKEHLAAASVRILPYVDAENFLASQEGTVIVDPSQINWRLYTVLGTRALEKISPVTLAKSLKNKAEISGIVNCHIRDGVALTAFLAWLENEILSGARLTEFEASEVLESYRRKMPLNVGLSFGTIAGYASNGAIIHYHATKETAAVIGSDSLFLLDSGGQYADGTTDTTRTVHFGVPDAKMKRCYSLVLKGHIALARAVFPEGTLGSRLDTLARMPLWSLGIINLHIP